MTTVLPALEAGAYYLCTCGHLGSDHAVEGTSHCYCGCEGFANGRSFRSCGHPADDDDCDRPRRRGKRGTRRRPAARRRKLPFRQVWDRDGWQCVTCGTHKDLTVDHITPLAVGGTDDFSNLQTMCRPCNSRKGARV